MAAETPKAGSSPRVAPSDPERASTDPRDADYAADDSAELVGQNPPHGAQITQTRGEPQDHDPTPPDPEARSRRES